MGITHRQRSNYSTNVCFRCGSNRSNTRFNKQQQDTPSFQRFMTRTLLNFDTFYLIYETMITLITVAIN